MKIPRPRLTIRRLMILVALAGLIAAGAATLRRRAQFAREQAASHGAKFRKVLDACKNPEDIQRAGVRINYYVRQTLRWRAAAARPWLYFEADPPAPK